MAGMEPGRKVGTLDTYGHLMDDEDDRSRAAIRAELACPAD